MNDNVTRTAKVFAKPGSSSTLATITVEDSTSGAVVTVARNVPWRVAHKLVEATQALMHLAVENQAS